MHQVNICRLHRIRKKCTNKNTAKKIQSITIKFKSRESRIKFYDARPRNFVNGNKKPGLNFL